MRTSDMTRKRRQSQKAGLPPGTLVHIGERKTDRIRLTLFQYREHECLERELHTVEEVATALAEKEPDSITWLNVGGIHDVALIERLGALFQLHALLLEDVVNTEQRPKGEEYGEYGYVVLKMLYCEGNRSVIFTEQISIVYAGRLVVSFQENGGDVFSPIRERLRTGKGRLRTLSADYLMYSLIDAIVDSYFAVLEVLGEKSERVEDRVLSDPGPQTLHDIYALKRELLFVRRAVWPLREVIRGLDREGTRFITDTTRPYLRDVYDHTIQVIDTVETLRDMVAGMLDIYLSSISNRMTAVMKVLTIITTIFMPLSFIAGVYGMNFDYMPELKSPWGYPIVLAAMATVGGLMVLYFKTKKWL
ncbi:MAG TPA: magnesium/cobalt transporter CorA [Nitrospiraceae bacterium]|nr:magnesium/cobalt transporter CorA [Nitrospiraceae bacterium]